MLKYILFIGILIFSTNLGVIGAEISEVNRGYYKAVSDFEKHTNMELKLPTKLPQLDFTYYNESFSEEPLNESLRLTYMNLEKPEVHYFIEVRRLKYKLKDKHMDVLREYRLENGRTAKLINFSGFNTLVFEDYNFQYILNVDKRVENKVPNEELVEIANSLEH
ncbi:MAG: hypothetical protein K0S51_1245 [Bacillales bacterium]|jgi:hypothetical protein|nr:hypothetical protein [Bacillales bacterium]